MLKKIKNYFRWLFSSDALPEIPSDLQRLPESKARIVRAKKTGVVMEDREQPKQPKKAKPKKGKSNADNNKRRT